MSAKLSPLASRPMAQALALSVTEREAAELSLERALILLHLEWATLDGGGTAQQQVDDDESVDDNAGAALEKARLAGDLGALASQQRLAVLRTMGGVIGDDAAHDMGCVSRFLSALAERGSSRDAWRPRGVPASPRCAALDALGAAGAEELLRGARAFACGAGRCCEHGCQGNARGAGFEGARE
eukprot:172220-Pleurochrysis_carterae.AAC.2